MSQLIGPWTALAWTALKAALLFLAAVTGLRLSQRRLLAELNPFDLVVTVAVGAIIGRSATSSSTAFLTGAVALTTLLVLHRGVAAMHRRGWLSGLLDRRPLVLLRTGRLQAAGLQAAGLTEREVHRLLRQAGEDELEALDYVLYEERGALTIVRADRGRGEAIRAGLAEAGTSDDE
ncbi:MAG: DUF421 domain-containing protein [Jatrophihabitans sp.]